MAKNLSRKVTIYINGKEVENTIVGIRAEIGNHAKIVSFLSQFLA